MQDTELPEKIEPTSLNFQTELAAQLAELVPEAMSDGKLDITKLREMVNGDAENSPEKFGLFWPGKRAAQALAQIPTTATLIPAPEESVDWENTKNIFIEGDNLEVLKALQNSYRRKVKMIYIDPPYNTGKEFIYPDKFSEGLQGYLEYTGQKNEVGENIESKAETGGRRHSNWLSMMYPRLQLAKSLLTDDGFIFISIDDNEQSNLKRLCDEVFGEDNFIANVPRTTSFQRSGQEQYMNVSHDYILVYSRNKNDHDFSNVTDRIIKSEIKEDKNGKYIAGDTKAILAAESQGYSSGGDYDFEYCGKIYKPILNNGKRNRWLWTRGRMQAAADLGILVPTSNGLRMQLYLDKKFEEGSNKLVKKSDKLRFHTADFMRDNFDNPRGTSLFKTLFDGHGYFDNPKPVELIDYLLRMATDKNSLVLDFFSGSSTTAHAVMQLNAEDDGSRSHIQVQLPELLDTKGDAYRAGFATIADISKERIRRAGKKIREDYADKIAKRSTSLDTGFRVYKLAPSNFVQWDENKAKDDIQQSVLDFAANKKPDAAPESLLTEIMLQARMPLSANIEKRDLQSGGWVYIVDGGNLIAYVANEQITEAQANEIADLAPAKLIVLDSAFNGNNALKINIANICKEKFIKEFKTI